MEVDTALARDEHLRSRDVKLSTQQLFLLDRPVRKERIPYLWVISFLFIGLGLFFYKMYLPSIGPSTSTVVGVEMSLLDILTDKTVLLTLTGCSLITILFLALKVGGVI